MRNRVLFLIISALCLRAGAAPTVIAYTPDPTMDHTPTLNWNAVSSAVSYKVQIDDANDFASPLVDQIVSGATTFTPGSDLSPGTVYWRVSSNLNYGDFSGYDDFVINSSAPTLTAYTPDPTTDYTPTLSWSAVSGASTYKIEIDDANDFATPVVTDFVSAATSYTPSPLLPATIYWRVSSDWAYGDFSAADDFVLNSAGPTLIAYTPDPTTDRTPTLDWNSVSGATSYKIEIDDIFNFSSPVVSQVVSGATSYTPGSDLPIGNIYWHVSTDLGSYDDWSLTDDFAINATPPTLTPYTPDPTLDHTPTLSWGAVSGATDYRVQVDDASSFATPLEDAYTSGATSYTTGTLTPGTIYWRVSSDLDYNEFAAYDDFVLNSSAPTLIAYTPDPTSDYTPTLDWNPVSGATSYKIQIDDASDFATPVVDQIVSAATSFTSPSLLPGTIYWRVSSDHEYSDFSAYDDFLLDPSGPTLTAYTPDPTTDRTPTLSWNAVSGATSYKIQIDDINTFASPTVDQVVSGATSYTPGSDLPLGTTYWHVSTDLGGYSDWSSTDDFVINPAPPTLTAYTPDPTFDCTPTLTWSAVSGATNYQVQVDDASDFATPLQDTYVSGATSYTATTLSPGTVYWRVSSNLDYAVFAAYDDFVINSSAPTLTAYTPDPTTDRTPTLSWNAVSGATSYKVQIDDINTFASPTVDQVVSGATSYTPGSDLPLGTTYWRVSSDLSSYTDWSSTDDFVINPDPPTLTAYTPDPTFDCTPTLTWSAVSGATNYQVQVDDASDFATPLQDTYVSGATSYTATTLSPGTVYWRVSSNLDYAVFAAYDDFVINSSAPTLTAYTPDPTTDRTPTLDWNPVSGATSYKVQIDDINTFASPTVDQVVSGATSYTPGSDLPLGTTYWRVSSDLSSYTDWSSTDDFVINPSPPTLTAYTPDPTYDYTPTLTWSAVSGATNYQVQVDDASDFATPLQDTYTSGATSYTATTLSTGTVYWRVSSNLDYAVFAAYDDFVINSSAPTLTAYTPDPTTDRTPTLDWNPVSGATSYKVQIDDINTFASPTVDQVVSGATSYTPGSDLPLGTTYWRVSTNINSYTDWSSTDDFVINPDPPTLTAYTPDPTLDYTPTLTWSAVSGAASYKVQIDDINTFASPTVDQIVSGATSYTPGSDLPLGTTYWRVSSNLDYAVFSATDDFVINSSAPTLTAYTPDPTTDRTPTLDWNPVSGATSYKVQIDDINTFASPTVDQVVSGATSYTSGSDLPLGTTYWRVSTNINSYADWSSTDDFVINATPPTLTAYTPDPTYDYTPTLTWSAVSGATNYQVQVDDASDFATPLQDTYTSGATSYTATTLSPGTVYWRVSSDLDYATFAAFDDFTINSSAPTLTAYTPDPTTDRTPTLDWNPVSGATSYKVQIDDINTFASPTVDQVVSGATSYTPGSDLPLGTTYWRVSTNINSYADWSSTDDFVINATPPTLTAYTPDPTYDYTPTLTWSAVSGATNYQVQVDDASDFATPLQDTYTSGATSYTATTLSPGTVYWRVSSDLDYATFAAFDDFTINSSAPTLTAYTPDPTTDRTPTLDWNPVSGATSYKVQIDDINTFASPTVDQVVSGATSYTSGSDLPLGTTYWRVSTNINSYADWSSTDDFVINATPPTLTAYTPDPTYDYTPTLTWSAVSGATNYQVQVDDASDFATPLQDTYTSGATSYTATTLSPGTVYWRVSSDLDYATFAAFDDFTINSSAPTLTAYTPDPTTDRTPTLDWNPVSGATSYKVQIDDINTFASPTVDQVVSGATSYTSGSDLPLGTTYWRVSTNINSYTDWSSTDDFVINLSPPTLTAYTPDPTYDYTPTLTWSAVSGATNYQVQVDDASDFATPLQDTYTSGATSYTATTLSPGTVYWRVSSDLDYATFAAFDDFTINSSAPTLTAYTPDPTTDRTPTLSWSVVSGATNYKIEIDEINTFASPTVSTLTGGATSYTPGSDLPLGTTYWRVSTNINSYADWSSTDDFVIDVTPPTLTAYTPDPTYDDTPTLTWSAVSGASNYQIQIDDANDYASPLVTTTTSGATSYTPGAALPYGTIYWHVSSNLDYTAYSASDDFTVLTAIPVLTAYSPDTTTDATPTLSWSSISGATSYKIQIDEINTFASPTVDQVVSGATSYTPATNLPYGDTYWRVSSNIDYSSFSAADQFYVRSPAPYLVAYPTDSTTDQMPTLSWVSVPGAAAYQVQVDSVNSFASPVVDAYVSGAITYTPSTALPLGKVYWRASSDIDFSVFGEIDSFVVYRINTPPTAVLSGPDTVREDIPATFTLTVADDETASNLLGITVIAMPSWLTANTPFSAASGTPGQNHVGDTVIVVSVSDGDTSVTVARPVVVVNVNDPPIVTYADVDSVVLEDVAYTQSFVVRDVDHSQLTVSISGPAWVSTPAAVIAVADTWTVSATPTNDDVTPAGTVDSVTLHVSDGDTGIVYRYGLVVQNVNDPPILTYASIETVAVEDSIYTQVFTLNDVDNDSVSIRVRGPLWLQDSGRVRVGDSWTLSAMPTNDDVNEKTGPDTVEIRVSDADTTVSLQYLLTVLNVNDPPFFEYITLDTLAIEDTVYEQRLTLRDIDNDTLTVEVRTPPWLGKPATSMMVDTSWPLRAMPTNDDVNEYRAPDTVRVVLSDNDTSVSLAWPIVVLNVNDPPETKIVSRELHFGAVRYGFEVSDVDYNDPESTLVVSYKLLTPSLTVRDTNRTDKRSAAIAPLYDGDYYLVAAAVDTHGAEDPTPALDTIAITNIDERVMPASKWILGAVPARSQRFDSLRAKAGFHLYQWDENKAEHQLYSKFRMKNHLQAFDRGKGYWLYSDSGGEQIRVQDTSKIAGLLPFDLTLKKGWNQVGCPFPFAVDLAWVRAQDTLWKPESLWTSDTAGTYRVSRTLDPWEGYWLHSDSTQTVKVFGKPFFPSDHPVLKRQKSDVEWQITVVARVQTKVDKALRVGISPSASDGIDHADLLRPPTFANQIETYIESRDAKTRYATRIGRDLRGTMQWEFVVDPHGTDGDIQLTLEDLEYVPESHWVYLGFAGDFLDMRKNEIFHLAMTDTEKRYFTLAVTDDPDFLSKMWRKHALNQNYPNPFNPITRITYVMPYRWETNGKLIRENEKASLKIYDVRGRLVKTLIDGPQEPGMYHVIWSSKDNRNRPVASSVYFYRLATPNFAKARKMILIK